MASPARPNRSPRPDRGVGGDQLRIAAEHRGDAKAALVSDAEWQCFEGDPLSLVRVVIEKSVRRGTERSRYARTREPVRSNMKIKFPGLPGARGLPSTTAFGDEPAREACVAVLRESRAL